MSKKILSLIVITLVAITSLFAYTTYYEANIQCNSIHSQFWQSYDLTCGGRYLFGKPTWFGYAEASVGVSASPFKYIDENNTWLTPDKMIVKNVIPVLKSAFGTTLTYFGYGMNFGLDLSAFTVCHILNTRRTDAPGKWNLHRFYDFGLQAVVRFEEPLSSRSSLDSTITLSLGANYILGSYKVINGSRQAAGLGSFGFVTAVSFAF